MKPTQIRDNQVWKVVEADSGGYGQSYVLYDVRELNGQKVAYLKYPASGGDVVGCVIEEEHFLHSSSWEFVGLANIDGGVYRFGSTYVKRDRTEFKIGFESDKWGDCLTMPGEYNDLMWYTPEEFKTLCAKKGWQLKEEVRDEGCYCPATACRHSQYHARVGEKMPLMRSDKVCYSCGAKL